LPNTFGSTFVFFANTHSREKNPKEPPNQRTKDSGQ